MIVFNSKSSISSISNSFDTKFRLNLSAAIFAPSISADPLIPTQKHLKSVRKSLQILAISVESMPPDNRIPNFPVGNESVTHFFNALENSSLDTLFLVFVFR